jgi:hypothetical protein
MTEDQQREINQLKATSLDPQRWDLLKNNVVYFGAGLFSMVLLFRKQLYLLIPQAYLSNTDDLADHPVNWNLFTIYVVFFGIIFASKIILRYFFYRMEYCHQYLEAGVFTVWTKLKYSFFFLFFFCFYGILIFVLGSILLNEKVPFASKNSPLQTLSKSFPTLLVFNIFYELLFCLVNQFHLITIFIVMVMDAVVLKQGFGFRHFLLTLNNLFFQLLQLFLFFNLFQQFLSSEIFPFYYVFDLWSCIMEIKDGIMYLFSGSGDDSEESKEPNTKNAKRRQKKKDLKQQNNQSEETDENEESEGVQMTDTDRDDPVTDEKNKKNQ